MPYNLKKLAGLDLAKSKTCRLRCDWIEEETACSNCCSHMKVNDFGLQIVIINELIDNTFCEQCAPLILYGVYSGAHAKFCF